ncbi:DUF6221 family protein [Streptomyces sp. NPDC006296]|uniref:DUF6221 family protein n=1 Tax=Streptomyces sp. NPDC006296 TaxID=3156746 RepID=UPI0033A18085
MSRELLDFLRARLQDDEDYARNAYADHNDAGPKWYEQWSGALNIGEEEDLVLTNDSAISRHMERHDPARVLAEVEAKRALLDDYERFVAERRRMMGGWDSYPETSPVLTAFATVYADHPDYRSEWRS